MSLDLCQVKQAQKPYFIENINTNIYSIEELCYYLYENVYLIDDTIMNEALCDWIRDELGLKKLYRQLYEHVDKQDGIVYFILPIFREIGYLDARQMREFTEHISHLEVQPSDARAKLKGDYLVRCGMYGNAVSEYHKILQNQKPGNLGTTFYTQVRNNLGCAYARMFRFEEAADCFLNAWKQVKTREMLRKYIAVLPMYLDEKEYRRKLDALGEEKDVLEMLQEYNLQICDEAAGMAMKMKESGGTPQEELEQIKEGYRRGAGCIMPEEQKQTV